MGIPSSPESLHTYFARDVSYRGGSRAALICNQNTVEALVTEFDRGGGDSLPTYALSLEKR